MAVGPLATIPPGDRFISPVAVAELLVLPVHVCVSLLLAENRVADWSVAFVCLCVFVCLSISALQVTIIERPSPNYTHK